MASRFAILGSGNSTSVPWLQCVMDASTRCSVCEDVMRNPSSKNSRHNPCGLLSFAHPDGRTRHILIDCGKTLREVVMRRLPELGVTNIDAVLLTHPHADAMLGLDDLRDVSPYAKIPVYLSASCFDRVCGVFPYLVTKPSTANLFIASIEWRIIVPFQPFEFDGLHIVPFPVCHGLPGPMLGFDFQYVSPTLRTPCAAAPPLDSRCLAEERTVPSSGVEVGSECGTTAAPRGGHRFVYISDVAALPVDTRAYLKSRPIDVLLLDALSYMSYPTHFSVGQAVACSLDLRPTRTVLVGMNHRIDYYLEQPRMEEYCASVGGGTRIEYGFDGWSVPLDLSTPRALDALCASVSSISVAAMAEGPGYIAKPAAVTHTSAQALLPPALGDAAASAIDNAPGTESCAECAVGSALMSPAAHAHAPVHGSATSMRSAEVWSPGGWAPPTAEALAQSEVLYASNSFAVPVFTYEDQVADAWWHPSRSVTPFPPKKPALRT
ncbi:MBL fold metallo-hydrolase [archaeon]|nr:MAG: MBL fold metallo-hydrolase [archaeon]